MNLSGSLCPDGTVKVATAHLDLVAIKIGADEAFAGLKVKNRKHPAMERVMEAIR